MSLQQTIRRLFPSFSKEECYFINDSQAGIHSGTPANITLPVDLKLEDITWDELHHAFSRKRIAILVQPSPDHEVIQRYVRQLKEHLATVELRLIILSNEEKWKSQAHLHYLYVLPLQTQPAEIKRLYFQLSSYF